MNYFTREKSIALLFENMDDVVRVLQGLQQLIEAYNSKQTEFPFILALCDFKSMTKEEIDDFCNRAQLAFRGNIRASEGGTLN